MVKSINNMNTLNALIKDELMAHKEYRQLANTPNIPKEMRNALIQMSNDEMRHASNLQGYKAHLKLAKKN